MNEFIRERKESTLDNGVRIVLFEKKDATPCFQIVFNSGSQYDPIDKYGLSHLAEHIISHNSIKYKSERERDKELELRGAYSRPYTTRERSVYEIAYGDPKQTKALLEIMFDEISLGEITEKELKSEKVVVENEIREDESDSNSTLRVWSSLFIPEPIKHDPLGSKESLKNISVNDVKSFHKNMIRSGTTVIATGDIDIEIFKEAFKNFPEQNAPFNNLNIGKLEPKRIMLEESVIPDTLNIVLGTRTSPFNQIADQTVLRLVKDYLLSIGVSPIFNELRHKRPLIYSYYVENTEFSNFGTFDITFQIEKSNFDEVIKKVSDIMISLGKNGLDEKELSFMKQYIPNSIGRWYETSQSWVEAHSLGEAYFPNNYLSIEKYLEFINKLTNKDIIKVLSKYFTKENILIAVKGDISDLEIKSLFN
ncbi:MAG TPA: pitrilysin family protein [Candidatus Dojkabacteria bacterium]|nr:pitrilysin family protein [Candidatus Dojkabacteria bacterium]